MSTADSASSEYVLGSSPRELARLGLQARILDGFSEAFLRNVGIGLGMHVLDVGYGAGDLTFLVADLVGPSGRVVGVDSSSDAVSAARARSKEAGLTHVEFIQADLSTGSLQLPERAFDALVGRLVLYVFKDPVSVVHNLLKHVRPAGLVAFHERAARYGQGGPQTPLRQTVGRWLFELGRRSGVDLQFGLKLYGVFVEAGLPPPELQHDLCVDGGPNSPYYDWMADTARSVLPALDRFGVASADELDIDTLAERLRAETVRAGGAFIPLSLVGAWTHTPL